MLGDQAASRSIKKLPSRSFLIVLMVVCLVLVGGGLGVLYFRPAPTTQRVPPTQTSCPQAGTARAAITAPLVLGTHQNVVYIVNEYQGATVTAPTFDGTLQRYDTTTGKKTMIVKTPYMSFSMAQVSPDGQWIVFVASRLTNQGYVDELRMVRVDGQGLQTLYCIHAGTDLAPFWPLIAWSPDQQSLAFTLEDHDQLKGTDMLHVYILSLSSGTLRPAIAPQIMSADQPALALYTSGRWLDNARLYMTSTGSGPMMYLLDTKNGFDQHVGNLQPVLGLPNAYWPCWDYDISPDHTHLFTTQCSGTSDKPSSPSIISIQSVEGSSPTTIFSSWTFLVTDIQAANDTTLLFEINNSNGSTDQNGLWKINIDGSHLTRLIQGHIGVRNKASEESWISVSRDGRMYATDVYNEQRAPGKFVFASLTGGTPTTILSLSDANDAFGTAIVGWTTM